VNEPLQHDGSLETAEFSPDGLLVATAADDNTARIWDARTGQSLTRPMKHDDHVLSARFSPDGKHIVTASRDFTAQIWDAQTGLPVTGPLKHPNWVRWAEFSPDGKRVVTASVDYRARVWDAQTGLPLTEPLRHEAQVWTAHFSPDGRRIVTASWDKTARVWDAQTGQPVTGPLRHKDRVWSAEFSPDGERVLTASEDNTARVWGARTGQLLAELRHGSEVIIAEFSRDGKHIVTASVDGTACVWDTAIGRALVESPDDGVRGEFSADGKQIVITRGNGARVWDTATGQPRTRWLKYENSISNSIYFAEFSHDGRRLATASQDRTARLWDVGTGRQLIPPLRHDNRVYCARFSPDGKRIVTASWDKTARVWNAQTGEALVGPLQHGDYVCDAQFSPDGERVVTASWDHTAQVWDARTGGRVGAALRHGDMVYRDSFSPDGKRVLTASFDKTARVWDAETGLALNPPLTHPGKVWFARFSPDGEEVVTTVPLTIADWLSPASFSPDGKQILTVSSAARLWQARTGQPLTELLAYAPESQSKANGEHSESLPQDNAARLWDVGFLPARLPVWLLPVAEAISGKRLNQQGTVEQTPLDRARTITETRQVLNRQPDDGDGVKWGRWLLATPDSRTTSPFSTMKVADYIESRIEEETQESLGEAGQLACCNPELFHRIAELRDGLAFARAGQWTGAVAAFSNLATLDPTDHLSHHRLAPLLVQSGDLDGYGRHCAQVLAIFGATTNPVVAERMAKDCLILPVAGIDLEGIAGLADTAVTRGRGHEYFAYFEFAKGLADYRQGHFASAVDRMQKTLAEPGVDYRDAQAYLVLAMAQHQSGKLAEARAALDKGAQIIETRLPRLESGDIGDNWTDWIIAHALLKEAQGLIQGEKSHGQ
jgi:WD40 repeat protein